jgi:hypothetical protein
MTTGPLTTTYKADIATEIGTRLNDHGVSTVTLVSAIGETFWYVYLSQTFTSSK